MHATSDSRMPDDPGWQAQPAASRQVFISYASQDASIAERLCLALEAQGIPCWIAPRDVRPGDLYADAILQAINACRILVLVLSQSSAASGHVLREVERASSKQRPILTLRTDAGALPPALEFFLSASHWLDAPGGDLKSALPRLIEALRGHLEGVAADARESHPVAFTARRAPRALWALIGLMALALAYFGAERLMRPKLAPPLAAQPKSPTFSPPAHSIAVLPFVNMSADPNQEYFSDGLSEELLSSLATIRDLQVAARTSSFSFKGKALGVAEIARALNVAAVLEGSIRKDGKHVRIAAQLIDARSGFRLWSNSYDRDLKDILALQAEIATAVTMSLKATLLDTATAQLELGGTQDPHAFDAYLRGERLVGMPVDKDNTRTQIAAYSAAVRLDPKFAKAYVAMALAQIIFASNSASSSEAHAAFEQARASAERAVALAPELGEAHSALGFALDAGFQDYAAAAAEHERALALSPGNSRVLLISARFLAEIGRAQAAVAHAQRAVVLDPLNAGAYRLLGLVLLYTHDYAAAIAAYDRALTINPQAVQAAANRGLALAALDRLEAARQSCAMPPLDWLSRVCLAVVLHRLGLAAEAQAQLAALKASAEDEFDLAYQYAQIYAQWGDAAQALAWLETAYRVRDPGLLQLRVDPLMDPLRADPRFRTILANMKFPE